jgi:ABC-type iron transport system FetAB permease component
MQENWWSHNTDKLILLFLVVMLWFSCIAAAIHIFHHDVDSMMAIAFISFMTGSVSTVLGALVMIMTGRVQDTSQKLIVPSTESPKP